MRNIALTIAISAFIAASCAHSPKEKDSTVNDPYSYELGVVGGFSELIKAGVKQLALSAPLSPSEMDRFETDAKKIAERFDVQVYRESDLLVTSLFAEDVAEGKEVLLLYKGNNLDQYFTLKSDKEALVSSGAYDTEARLDIARRFGRMLSYSPREINRLLSQNTSFRTLDDFGIRATNLFLYYNDLDRALDFYSNSLGMELVADYEMAHILRITSDSYLILVDASKGMHTAKEPKTVALALLTAQLNEWYTYLMDLKVPMKYKYNPEEGSAHDGFVAIDPEGYLLEFERFNQHPENESFIPILNQNRENEINSNSVDGFPEELKIHSTITWLYYQDLLNMQNFYQDIFGLTMVADQGWTKIYQVSITGFLGLVDCRRGMHGCTKKKAVNVGFIIDDLEGWYDYVRGNKVFDLYEDELGSGPEDKYKAFVGFCPEDYYLEFDHFYPHEDNTLLLNYLKN
jgi:catechol 2,3-dioxygenase-like lactoylglutathione lyase family enzyme